MKKLWQKETTSNVNEVAELYTSGDDVLSDQKLIPYDIYGSAAHVRMLQSIKLINQDELKQILSELKNILAKYEAGQYVLQFGDEDVHTRIENDVTATHKEAGEKIHTGRSRNDQVLVDIRLFTKDHLQSIALQVSKLSEQFLQLTKKYQYVPMPGYTHMQQAMLSSVGLWLEQFVESLNDDLDILNAAYELNDQSPLGSGASYGVSLPLNREMTAQLLGFAKLQSNSLYCQNSRGKIEGMVLHAFSQVMLTLGRFAQDMLLFTTSEFQFFNLADELTTGSSIMPQKRNMDILELVRAKTKVMLSYENLVMSIVTGLPSGYNRDLQEIKKPYFAAFDLMTQTLDVVSLALSHLTVNIDKLEKVITPELYAAHHAYTLMQQEGLTFRKAYQKVGSNLQAIPSYQAAEVLKTTNHTGAAGNLSIVELQKSIFTKQTVWQTRKSKLMTQLSSLLS